MKIFLSSTYNDLITYRERVKKGLEGLGTHVEAMEVWFARPDTPLDVIKKKIEECDLYVGIYAHKYGSIVPNSEYSFTEWEYEYAKKCNKPPFCFLIDETVK
ncbi:MAG: DUF4062 domain-containing protein, partial [Candidatus Hermodarchaeota archaeon]